MTETPAIVALGESDNVVVAIRALAAGERVHAPRRAGADPRGRRPVRSQARDSARSRPAADVVKYDEVIGRATEAIAAGGHVHVHNVVSARLPGALPPTAERTVIRGYRRADGRAGRAQPRARAAVGRLLGRSPPS